MVHWDQYSAPEQATLVQIGKHAGYRFVLDRLTFPAAVATNTPFTVSAEWSNLGITPAYEPVVVAFELRPQGQSQVAWSGRSQLDLEALLPTSAPQAVADTLRLPDRLPPGAYSLSLALLDPTGYRPPLALAVQGRDAAGRYPLGTLTVRQGPRGHAAFLPALRSR